jgi:outer membrane protein TolC
MKIHPVTTFILTLLTPVAVMAQPAPAAAQARAAAIETLSLDAAVRMAVEHNRRVRTARLEVDKADANVAIARTKRLPVFDVEAKASQLLTPVDFSFPAGAFGTFPGTGPIPAVDTNVSVPRQATYYVASQIAQPITQLFRINLGLRAAETAREIETQKVRAERLAVVSSVKQLYFAILQTRSAMAASEEAIALYRELDRTLTVRVAQKVALRGDALDVQYRLAQEELTRVSHENALASRKEQLNQLLGRDVRAAFDVEEAARASVLDIDLDIAQRRAFEERPDLQQARLALRQAELDRRIAKAERIPDVSVGIGYTSNFNIDVLPKNLATFGVQVKWEPFDWGRKRSEVTSKVHTVDQARLGLRDLEDRVVIDINSAFRTLKERRAALAVAEMSRDAVREKLRVKTTQYHVQTALLPDVLQVRAELAATDDRYQQALLAFWTAKANFDNAVGEEVTR